MARGGVAGFYTPLRDQHNPHVFNEPLREELLLLEVLEHDRHCSHTDIQLLFADDLLSFVLFHNKDENYR
ncbi:hypothetical protein TNIN_248201 [Trichonephila inaurata madagascariensis]|uniref:Uncharacterized protein n=1 Tax=Trichonephila inaurata madagascariensis TaxID=2747483 RepID=A0A8X6Y5Z0_9ARAC|nr:hypothetical protein TNIN_248201 [Trichonephila inaurata madagascariensis]